MYVWIWRTLPGNVAAKLAGSLLILVGVLAVLFLAVFPFVEPRLPWNNVNVDQPTTSSSSDQPNVQHSGLVRLGSTATVFIPSTKASRA